MKFSKLHRYDWWQTQPYILSKTNGSLFLTYKDYFSIFLLKIADINYKCITINIKSYGKEGNSKIFKKSSLYKLIQGEYFPPSTKIPLSD